MKILCIEDDPLIFLNYEDIADALRDEGIDLILAKDYHTGLHKLEREAPVDCIISDWEFPGALPRSLTGGGDFYQRIRSSAEWGATPFLFLSGMPKSDIEAALRKAGETVMPERIYQKPAPLTKIIDDIRRTLVPMRRNDPGAYAAGAMGDFII